MSVNCSAQWPCLKLELRLMAIPLSKNLNQKDAARCTVYSLDINLMIQMCNKFNFETNL